MQNAARICCRYLEADMLVAVHTESPLVAVRAPQGSVGERVTFTWMTFRDCNEGVEKRKKRTEEEGSRLEAHHRPRRLLHDCAGTFSSSALSAVWCERASSTSESFVYTPEYPA